MKFNSSQILAGLEIGTSKVSVVVGECNPMGGVTIVGAGQARSNGVRKGEIIDPKKADEDIRLAIAEAEQNTDMEIRSVYLGVSGSHIRGFNNRGMHPVLSRDREIVQEDVNDVLKNAKTINLSAEHYVVHAIRQHFIVDGHDSIRNPVGMFGDRIEVDMHVVHGVLNRLQNSIRVIQGMQIEVSDVVFNGLGSALAVLSSEQKEMGTLVIDMGAGTTEYVVYCGGIVRHTGVLAVGGDHVSNDLAYGLKVTQSRAESLKIDHGSALPPGDDGGGNITISGRPGEPDRVVDLGKLRMITHMRTEEILELIRQDLEKHGVGRYVHAGVVITGGAARIPKLARLAGKVFGLPARVSCASAVGGSKDATDQLEYVAGIGLVKFGSFQHKQRDTRGIFPQTLRQKVGGWLSKGKKLML